MEELIPAHRSPRAGIIKTADKLSAVFYVAEQKAAVARVRFLGHAEVYNTDIRIGARVTAVMRAPSAPESKRKNRIITPKL